MNTPIWYLADTEGLVFLYCEHPLDAELLTLRRIQHGWSVLGIDRGVGHMASPKLASSGRLAELAVYPVTPPPA